MSFISVSMYDLLFAIIPHLWYNMHTARGLTALVLFAPGASRQVKRPAAIPPRVEGGYFRGKEVSARYA